MVIGTTKLSSKGQLVIPEIIRDKLGFKSGDEFVVSASEKDNAVLIKLIELPESEEFEALLVETRAHARKVGMKKSDIKQAISKARRKKYR
ncbi:MAG: AbrB/MazE/SpoVT family DNA-binding domain-containing protein [Bdellovibrio sp.]|nr:AbrB/MazE/SpoVT family DNA-binding domain-containing protein [Bdellovibrio sp.]